MPDDGYEMDDRECLIALTAAVSAIAGALQAQDEPMPVATCKQYGANLSEVLLRIGHFRAPHSQVQYPTASQEV